MNYIHSTPRFVLLGAASILIGLNGCAVGPDYKTPDSTLAPNFINAIGPTAEPVGDFWRGFNDPVLNGLVDDARKANHDIRIAVANLREARASLRFADAQALPTIGVSADAARVVVPSTQAPGSRSDRTVNVYDAGVDASWELDFFGRYSRGSEAARATLSAAEAGVQSAQVSVVAEVARNYFQLRGQQRQLIVAQESLANQESNSQLVETRFSVGRGTELDTARARAQVENTRAAIPALEAAIERSRYRLAVLTGRPPNELAALVAEPKPLPGLAPIAGIGTPSALLQRRPDIRSAERQLAAATANIGVAKASLFPTVSITGLLGLNAGRVSDLNAGNSFVYNLGASIAWTLIDFGRIRARIGQNEARAEAALAQYEKTVLTALEETEGALVTYNRTNAQVDSLFKAAKASARAAELARIRFDAGASDFLTVLDAERQLLADQNQLAQAQTAAGTALIAVYKALGGGWN